MMASMGWIGGSGADTVVAWLLTYAVHSTILLGAAAVVTMRLVRADAWRETVWRAALVGALVTSALQSGLGMQPLGGEWRYSLDERSRAGQVERTSALPSERSQSDGLPLQRSASDEGATAPGSGEVGARADQPTVQSSSSQREAPAAPSTSPEQAAPAALSSFAQRGEVGPGAGAGAPAPSSGSVTRTLDGSAVRPESVTPSQSGAATGSDGANAVMPAWSRVLLVSWAIVALVLLVRLAHRQWRLHRWLHDRRPVTQGDLLSVLAALRRNAGVWRPVELTASPACPSPLALGTSEICVPERFLWALDPEQQRSALAHELAHIARRDPGWHLLAGLVEAVFFFQPLNRLARLRLREAAEHLSDDWAVHQTGSALGLARCLAEVASWVGRGAGPVASGTMAMAEGGSPLLQRVERLLGGGAGHMPRGRLRTVTATLLVLSVLIAAPVVSAGDDASDRGNRDSEASGATGSIVGGSASDPGQPRSAQPETRHSEPGTDGAGGDGARRTGVDEWTGESTRSSEAGTGSAQEQVIRHGSPDEPLESRWQWAADEAEQRADADYWVAYAFDRPLPAGHIHIDDSGSWSTSELDDAPLGSLIYGPSYDRPDDAGRAAQPPGETSLESLQPVLVLFQMIRSRAGAVHVARVSVRSASAGMSLRGAPLYWLGPASDAESFEWLRARVDELHDARLQGTVVEAISMHETADRVVPFLADVIASERPNAVREEAVEGLAWQVTDQSVALLRETALEDHSRTIREEAAETLGELRTPAAVTALEELLRAARSDAVREEAVEALAARQDPDVLETIVSVAMEDPESDVRGEALDAIAGFPSSSAVPALERIALTHPRADMRAEAVESLGDVDPAAAADVLERILQSDAHSRVREEALDVLAARRSPGAAEAIFQAAMTDPDPDVQEEAVERLRELEPAAALSRLEQIVWTHPRTDLRREAVESLAELPSDIALPVLDDIVDRHEDHEVAREAVEVIGEFPADASMDRLMRIVREHPWDDVRREALEQLSDRMESQ